VILGSRPRFDVDRQDARELAPQDAVTPIAETTRFPIILYRIENALGERRFGSDLSGRIEYDASRERYPDRTRRFGRFREVDQTRSKRPP
jgi:hypothetical protein